MVSRLERWAEDARRYGFSEVAALIENQANVLRKAGVPEEFHLEVTAEDRIIGKLRNIKKIRSKLVEAMMSTVLPKKDTPFRKPREAMVEELAKVINQKVGQHIADDIKTEDLVLPQKGESLRNTGFEGLEQVGRTVRACYNRCMNGLARGDYSIGEIRKASLRDIASKPGITYVTSSFAKIAFAQPQPSEGKA